MATDYGYWSALTQPLITAGQRQQQREAQDLQALQLMQKMKAMQLGELENQKAVQSQVTTVADAALSDLYTTKNKFARPKDVEDFKDWHSTSSGWSDIQGLLRQYGSINNARLYGNLDYVLEKYKHSLKDNPISKRASQNKPALEAYHGYSLSEDKSHLLTSGSRERYNSFINGDTDKFVFLGARTDYLSEDNLKDYSTAENITIDKIIANNYGAILRDIAFDKNISDMNDLNDLSYEDIKTWVEKETKYNESGNVGYFNNKAIYGKEAIDTSWSREIVNAVDGVSSLNTHFNTIEEYYELKEKGYTFEELFSANNGVDFERLGGIQYGTQPYNKTGELERMLSGGRTSITGSPKIFINPGVNQAITKSWAGEFKDGNPKYNTETNKVYDINTLDLFTQNGHQIKDEDIGSMNITGKDLWQESKTMDLELLGYHVVPVIKGVENGIPTTMLLADVKDSKELEKYKKEYEGKEISYAIVAELKDTDYLTYSDYYYKEIKMDINTQGVINQSLNNENLNETLTQMSTLDQKQSQKAYELKRKDALKVKLQKSLNLPNAPAVKQVVDTYDKILGIGLKMADVPTGKVQAVMPMIISDLYVGSREEREYPFKIDENTIAYNASEYMAYMAQRLKKGLQTNPKMAPMLDAIKKGPSAYEIWRKANMKTKQYNQTSVLSRDLAKYYNS